MKKINRDGIRALILETLEEVSLGEAKSKVKEAEGEVEAPPIDPEDEIAAAGRGAREQEPSETEVAAMNTPELQKEKAKIDKAFEFYEQDPGDATLPLVITTLETSLKFLKSIAPKPAAQQNQG